MAMSARVTNSNGRIIAEKRNGQRRYHQHGALGNTIAANGRNEHHCMPQLVSHGSDAPNAIMTAKRPASK